jgi:hypothetical protein
MYGSTSGGYVTTTLPCFICGGTGQVMGMNPYYGMNRANAIRYGYYDSTPPTTLQTCYGCGGLGSKTMTTYVPPVSSYSGSSSDSSYSSGSGSGSSSFSSADSGYVTCRSCKGTGKCGYCDKGITISDSYYTGLEKIVHDCGVCKGTGNCGTCRGTGRISTR